MQIKFFEVRDSATCIPVMCVDITCDNSNERQDWLIRKGGFGPFMTYVYYTSMTNHKTQHDPYAWGDRTHTTAHDYILRNWEKLKGGEVIDVEYIRGEAQTVKKTEQTTYSTADEWFEATGEWL